MNYHKPKYRIKKYDKGYVSEVLKPRWTLFGIRYKWTHFLSVSGMSDKPWYFSNYRIAEEETLKYLSWDITEKSNEVNGTYFLYT